MYLNKKHGSTRNIGQKVEKEVDCNSVAIDFYCLKIENLKVGMEIYSTSKIFE